MKFSLLKENLSPFAKKEFVYANTNKEINVNHYISPLKKVLVVNQHQRKFDNKMRWLKWAYGHLLEMSYST